MSIYRLKLALHGYANATFQLEMLINDNFWVVLRIGVAQSSSSISKNWAIFWRNLLTSCCTNWNGAKMI